MRKKSMLSLPVLSSLLIVSLTIASCGAPEKKPNDKAGEQAIVATTGDSVLDTETNQVVPDSGKANKFYVMQISKDDVQALLDNPSFAMIQFVMEDDDARNPKKTTLVAYAMNDSLNYLYKDASGNPIPLNLIEAPVQPKLLKGGKKITWSQYYFGRRAIEARIASAGGSYAYMQFDPRMNSPITYSVLLVDGGSNKVGTECELQPSPPAQPGFGECR